MSKRSRPGNLIQAKAYAANDATRMGMRVEGMLMMRLLMKALPMPRPVMISLSMERRLSNVLFLS